MIKLLIADDHEIYRHGLIGLLKNESNIEIIGEAANGLELLEHCSSNYPDVIFIDIKMPRMNGIEATKEIKSLYPDIKIIALTMFTDEIFLTEMLNVAANGYLLKTAERLEIINAITVVHEGGVYYCKQTALKLKKYYNHIQSSKIWQEREAELSPREIEIIKLICQQFTTKEIATKLMISHRTVDSHRNIIQQKIDAKNMVGIVLYAIRNGLFSI